jgi:hypothetical protein
LGVSSNSSDEAGSDEGLHFQMFGRVGGRY